MIGAEVCIYVNFFSLLIKRGRNGWDGVEDDGNNPLVLSNIGVFKGKDDYKENLLPKWRPWALISEIALMIQPIEFLCFDRERVYYNSTKINLARAHIDNPFFYRGRECLFLRVVFLRIFFFFNCIELGEGISAQALMDRNRTLYHINLRRDRGRPPKRLDKERVY